MHLLNDCFIIIIRFLFTKVTVERKISTIWRTKKHSERKKKKKELRW